MTTLKLSIDNQVNAKSLVAFLRTVGYVKSISFEKPKDTLIEIDWTLPGRAASKMELDNLIDAMDCDNDTGKTTEQMLSKLNEWKRESI